MRPKCLQPLCEQVFSSFDIPISDHIQISWLMKPKKKNGKFHEHVYLLLKVESDKSNVSISIQIDSQISGGGTQAD